ncbi:hypothetical protein DRQ09_09260 [candidate division KSB1 bacterium]|nr:MAG: hypothetical protein DRQ09_09260 [candidate division KSB1 bacterium]
MKTIKVFLCLFILTSSTIIPASIHSQETILLDNKIINAIINEVSGDIALHNELMLGAFERNRPESEYTGHFWESDYMVKKAKEYGFEDVHIETWKLEGQYQWDGVKGELWLVEPDEKRLASYDEISASLAKGSLSTNVTAELVSAGAGTSPGDYKNVNVEGKIVLVTGNLRRAHQLAVQRGAYGVVWYDSSPAQKYPDIVHWRSISAEIAKKAKHPSFGFILSQRMGSYLANRLKRGEKLVVHAETKTRFYPKKMEVVTAFIPGTDLADQEFLFVAHLFEGIAKQGGNDNYSGCVCELEVGRTIIKLLKDGKIPPLRRSIRFIWVPEIEGTKAYLERFPEEKKKIVAGINMDMVGEGLSKCHTLFWISRTPHSIPHFINDICQEFAELTVKLNNDADARYPGNPYGQFSMRVISPSGSRDLFHLGITRYESGSDHIVLVNGEVRIPTVYFECWSEDFYHTNMDTPDKSDPTQLKRVAFIATASTITFCCATPEDAPKIATETLSRSRERIARDLKKSISLISKAKPENLYRKYKNAHIIITQSYLRETENLESLKILADKNPEILKYIEDLITDFNKNENEDTNKIKKHYELYCKLYNQTPRPFELTEEEITLSKMIPERTEKKMKRVRIPFTNSVMRTRYASFEALNFVNGKRSILDIANAVFAEYGNINPEDMKEFILAYVKEGILRLK